MRITTIFIGIVLASLFVAGFSALLTDGITHYNTSYDASDLARLQRLDKTNETYIFAVDTGQAMQGGNEEASQEGINTDVKLSKTVNVFYNSINTAKDGIIEVADILGIPTWFLLGILSILIITMVVAILVLIGVIKGGNA